jgi:hypothetical protein
MQTIDGVLPHLNQNIKLIEPLIPKKDKRIIVSLAKQLQSGVFLTENQGKLLVKILNENISVVQPLLQNIKQTLSSNTWSKEFRVIQKVRKISIDPLSPDRFFVEFNFNTRLKDKLVKNYALIEGQVSTKGTINYFLLTENNIFLLVSLFINDGFEIDEKIMDFYRNIVEIKTSTKSPFDIFSTSNEKLKKAATEDVKILTRENLLLLQDRKIRYQYEISEQIEKKTLTEKIAHRANRRIYINPQEIPFVELVRSLVELNRFPLMLVFEGSSSEKDKNVLTLIENAVSELALTRDIGVYFRYDKEADSAGFNQEIAKLSYNKNLSGTTVIAGITNTKLPKFMIKTGWKPQTVVTFTNSFRANRTSVYCTDVDLVVYYTGTQPLDDKIHAFL